ncbi:hypothetical protein Air01nite_54720 [Asanoa iriomotensis]|uniref:Uncharacterized protein n=1 Tax=Asanoa iriomotensis TaxID=234613 RepID=A0ABQ4C9B7_9ACTN|nr:hypothetical protein Air01nite_54720 [Asanoa iriomotensis]
MLGLLLVVTGLLALVRLDYLAFFAGAAVLGVVAASLPFGRFTSLGHRRHTGGDQDTASEVDQADHYRRRRWRLTRIWIAVLIAVGCGIGWFYAIQGPNSSMALPTVSIRYVAEIETSGSTTTLRETVICDSACETNIGRTVGQPEPGGSLAARLVMPAGWSQSAQVDGSPVYARSRTVPHEDPGLFDVVPVDFRVDIGLAHVEPGGEVFGLRPADGSSVTITAPKGAVGKTDPATAKTSGLPGGGRLESSAISLDVLSESVAFEILGSAWRNPAGRQLYDLGSWGYLPWILSFVVLTCAGLARDYLVEKLKAVLTKVWKRRPPERSGRERPRRRIRELAVHRRNPRSQNLT